MKKIITSVSLSLLTFFGSTQVALAVDVPTFPTCVSPQGSIRAEYQDGVHGIVGSSATYTGKDTVYNISDDMVMQCFCADDGVGIQTNWWKASSLTNEQIDILKSEGWYYVPAGDLWGLEASPYVAKNIAYSCRPSSSNPPGTGTGGGESGGGSISGASTQGSVLGLAATGDSLILILLALLSTILIVAGLKRSTSHEK
jgi:hypothetical protein